jgi:taurine dioxygenase
MTSNANAFTNTVDPGNPLHIVPVSGRIGAEIRDISLSADLSDETAAAIRNALARHKVLFFRGQNHLDDAAQEGFAARLGEPMAHPAMPVVAGTSMLELNSADGVRANVWHTDLTGLVALPFASVLRGVVIPDVGGDTVFANTAVAYENLPEELRALADRLWVLHENTRAYEQDIAEYVRQNYLAKVMRAIHPLVHVHPETGERALLLGGQIEGFSKADSQRFTEILQSYVTRLENTVRWRWSTGDVVIWDNRATQHYAIDDYGDQKRVVRRVTLRGEPTVSVDGRRSREVPTVQEKATPAAA